MTARPADRPYSVAAIIAAAPAAAALCAPFVVSPRR